MEMRNDFSLKMLLLFPFEAQYRHIAACYTEMVDRILASRNANDCLPSRMLLLQTCHTLYTGIAGHCICISFYST